MNKIDTYQLLNLNKSLKGIVRSIILKRYNSFLYIKRIDYQIYRQDNFNLHTICKYYSKHRNSIIKQDTNSNKDYLELYCHLRTPYIHYQHLYIKQVRIMFRMYQKESKTFQLYIMCISLTLIRNNLNKNHDTEDTLHLNCYSSLVKFDLKGFCILNLRIFHQFQQFLMGIR